VLYVGKAVNLASRVRSYLSHDPQRPQMDEMRERAVDVDTILTGSEIEALLLESTLIRQHRPHYNILLKDDKSFPFVKLSVQEEWPRLSVTRRVVDDGARYVGPFTDVKALRSTLRDLRRIFPLRTCRNFDEHRRQNRPCLYYHIRRCAGPCYSRARVERATYMRMVDDLVLLLSGRNDELLGRLKLDMARAAEARRYEVAAQRRDQIALLERARVPQSMVTSDPRDTDVLGFARSGDRAAIATVFVREGRVIGKEMRLVERAGGTSDAELLEIWVTQHALARQDLPRARPREFAARRPRGARRRTRRPRRSAGGTGRAGARSGPPTGRARRTQRGRRARAARRARRRSSRETERGGHGPAA
jgi:excinuclease ABC subunit C